MSSAAFVWASGVFGLGSSARATVAVATMKVRASPTLDRMGSSVARLLYQPRLGRGTGRRIRLGRHDPPRPEERLAEDQPHLGVREPAREERLGEPRQRGHVE